MKVLSYLFPNRVKKNKVRIPVGYSLNYALSVLQKAYSCKYIGDEYKEIEY